jgi:aspartyl-tRNA(Asn)/glutamyl-tRNA(Gln) amidotransferase subunit A
MRAEPHTLAQLAHALESRQTTSEAVVDRCLQRIADRNPTLNAFITVSRAAHAKRRGRPIAISPAAVTSGPLHGVPISLKDLFDVRGAATTAASRVRQGHLAERDAPSVAALRQAGAIVIGKTNLHEFAFGTTNEDSGVWAGAPSAGRQPFARRIVRRSAASVADGMCFASMGTDTGGSIRIPSSVCGLVGLKPAVGELSTEGVVPLSATLDHIGPLCRSVEDAALVYDVLRGALRATKVGG